MLQVPISNIAEERKELPYPAYASNEASGMDLRSAALNPIQLKPLQRALIPTGISISLPRGYEAQVRSRSGWALKHGITVLNAPGTIDSDYRGEIGVILINLGEVAISIEPGDRIAQLVVAAVSKVQWENSSNLNSTGRGSNGFGSTGHG